MRPPGKRKIDIDLPVPTCYNKWKSKIGGKMAKNTGNNRIPVKWVRDKAKAAYEKKDVCYICGTKLDLELHHTHSITLLLNGWAHRNSYDISTDDGILAVRDKFIEEHRKEIYDDVYTLCNPHHVALHAVYGKAPSLISARKQGSWIEKQKAKYQDGYVPEIAETKDAISFAEFAGVGHISFADFY